MPRISERISNAMATVTCPGCGKRVVPTAVTRASPESAPAGAPDGARWSFIWRPPSGDVCPECFFPLQRFARRIWWIRSFFAGVALLTGALFLLVLRMLDPAAGWAGTLARIVGLVGGVVLVIGAAGVAIGGRSRGPEGPPS